jgi:alkylation response protein AidB-like acyl-CoA dehydrogenase
MMYMTDERRMIQEAAREFTRKEVIPLANKLDPVKGDIPMELRDKLAEMGYFGIMIPEEYGGMGLGCFEYCLITEELARGWMSVSSIIARTNTIPGLEKMDEARKREFLPQAARGDWIGAVAMSEPGTGSDLSSMSCRAVRDGDSYVITHQPAARGQEAPGHVGLHRREKAGGIPQGPARQCDPQDRLLRHEDLRAGL